MRGAWTWLLVVLMVSPVQGIEMISCPPYREGDLIVIREKGLPLVSVEGFGKKGVIVPWKEGVSVGLLPIPLGIKGGFHLVTCRTSSAVMSWTLSVEALPAVHLSLTIPSMTKKTVAALSGENKKLKDAYAPVTPQKMWTGHFRLPCNGRMTSGFGESRVYNKKLASWRHQGVDYGPEKKGGTDDVWASQHGRVVLVEAMAAHGGTVVVDHGWGLYTMYLHLDDIRVQIGDRVATGDCLGHMGKGGISTGTHVHWGAKLLGTTINPVSLLKLTFKD